MTTPFTKSAYVSQSESKDAQRCHLRWYARWVLGARSGHEGPAARIGTIGHAVLASMSRGNKAPHQHREAAEAEAVKRLWWADGDLEPDWFGGEFERGLRGAALVRDEVAFGRPVEVNRAPLVEERLYATWSSLLAWCGGGDMALGDIAARLRRRGRLGIEGQMDLVHRLVVDDALTVHVDDYKFRQKSDLGGTLGRPNTTAIDPQGAYYSVLLRACGAVGPDEPVVFRQVNAYAGPWLTVDDFVEERVRCLASGARGRLTTDAGLPTRDVERMEAMVSPEAWGEAHRVLANMRHGQRLAAHESALVAHRAFLADNPKSRRQTPKPPERLTAAEEADARRFVADLAARPLVQVQTCSLDPGACLELVRDMLAAVLAAEEEVASGIPPARVFDPYPRGQCLRPYGCEVAVPCQASLGSGDAVAAVCEHAAQGRARVALRVLPEGVGDEPLEDA